MMWFRGTSLPQQFLDGLHTGAAEHQLEGFLYFSLAFRHGAVVEGHVEAGVDGLLYGLALGYQGEKASALGMRLGMLVETAIVLVSYVQGGREDVHREAAETVVAFGSVDEDETDALVVVEVGGYEMDAPKVGNGEVAVARSVLTLAGIARGAQVDVGKEAAHEWILVVYSGQQNGILVRLRGGLLADNKTVFFPATLAFVSKFNVPYGGLCI